MRTGTLEDGAWGFDCNATVSPKVAKRFKDAGYSFVVRYVRRSQHHDFDISASEMDGILEAGLGLMLVQHVAAPGWSPTKILGQSYGAIAGVEAHNIGYPSGATLWCDLEGVADSASPSEVIDYLNSWHEMAREMGYTPGLYVGDSCGLTATELYKRLRFKAYWSAFNLNKENVPSVRGTQMRQKPYPPRDRRIDCPFEYDEDLIVTDKLGGTPTLAFA